MDGRVMPDIRSVSLPERALVTGGAGFIGSHVAARLLQEGVRVAILDNLSTGVRSNVPQGARLFEGDIREPEDIRAVMESERPEVVFHLAAQMDVRRSVREPEFDAATNVLGSLRLMLSAMAHGVRRIVYASSGGAAYGDVERLPVSERQVPAPVSEYGASKLAVEHYLSVYHARGKLETVALRLPNVFGPRQRPDGEAGVVSIFAGRMLRGEECAIYGDGSKQRDYVYVADVVRAFLLALGARSGSVLNLGTGVGTSDRQVFDAVAAAVGYVQPPRLLPFRDGEVRNIALDASAARRAVGWEPVVGFDEGVAEVIRWMRSASA